MLSIVLRSIRGEQIVIIDELVRCERNPWSLNKGFHLHLFLLFLE